MRSLSLVNETKNPIPRIFFRKVADTVMPKNYALSVIFTTPKKIGKLNGTYRKKHTSTDILSFALSKSEGELYISMKDVIKKAPLFYLPTRKYLEYLFIHGLVHLKGMEHGKKMERLEKKFCTQFGFQTPPYAS